MSELLDEAAVSAALTDLPGWEREGDALVRTVTASSFPAGIALVDRVALVAEDMGHHPDIDIRWTAVRFACSSHEAGGITAADLDLARRISAAADQRG